MQLYDIVVSLFQLFSYTLIIRAIGVPTSLLNDPGVLKMVGTRDYFARFFSELEW